MSNLDNGKKQKRYGTIVLDPPWDVQQKGGSGRGAERHYQLMNLERIKSLPVSDLMAENGHVWLWVTNASLQYAFDILEAWGLTYRSIFTWIKPRMGLGNYLRNCSEAILLATKGKSPIRFNAQMNWGFFPVQDHSHKPEEIHKIIERCSPPDYLEMFARRKFPGWDVWGNEVESDIDIPGYPVPCSPATRNQNNSQIPKGAA